MSRRLALLLLGLASACASAPEVLRVEPGGLDLAAAIALARARPEASAPVVLELAPGDHVLRAGLVIDAGGPPLVIRAQDPRSPPRLVGALTLAEPRWSAPDAALLERLDPLARAEVVVLAFAPESLAGWNGGLSGPVHAGHTVEVPAARSVILVGAQPLEPARWPNVGFAPIETVLDVGSVPRQSEGDIPLAERVSEPPRGGVFVPLERTRVARWAQETDLWAAGYWNWDWSDELLPVARVDAERGSVTLARPHRYGLAQRGKFALVHALAELDAPFEFWLDVEHARLVAWIPPEARHDPVTVTLLAEPLLTLDSATDVRLEDLRFECTRAAGIVARGVERVTIERCSFATIGTLGVDLEGRDSTIAASTFESIGGRGVRLAGGDRATLTPGHLCVRDSSFRRCSELQRSYHPAIELDGVGLAVLHNEISDLPHFALTFRGNDHHIADNLIHHVVQETGDAGAIYCGRDWTSHGTVLERNLVHSIAGSDARYQNAFYMDDMASGITLRSNLVVDCNWGMLLGGGRDLEVRANAFVACRKALSYDARGVGWMAPHIADPSTSTLHQRYAAMPIESELWRLRFPTLPRYLDDRLGRPVGGRVLANHLVGTPLGTIEDRECVEVSGTTEESLTGEALTRYARALIERARHESITLGACTLGPVGPRVPSGAGGMPATHKRHP
jgi:hypothetical protein